MSKTTHSLKQCVVAQRDRQTVQAASVKIIYIMYDETRSKPIKSIPFFRRCLHPICIYPHGVHLALPFYQCYAYDEIIMMEPTLPNAPPSLCKDSSRPILQMSMLCVTWCIDWMTLTKSQAVDCCFCTGARKMIISSFSCDHETPQRDHQSQIVTIRVPRF